MLKRTILLITILFSFLTTIHAATITGMVENASTGEEMEGALIYAVGMNRSTFSGDDGSYSLTITVNRDIRFCCEMFGFEPQYTYVMDGAVGTVFRDFSLQPEALGTVSGTVTNEDGDPLADILVQAWKDTVAALSETRTDDDGLYALQLPAGHAFMIQAFEGNQFGRLDIAVPGEEEYTADIVLSDSSNLVTGPDNYGYVAVENADPHPMAPVYEWYAVDPLEGGDGERVDMAIEEEAHVLDLPFTFQFYGIEYNEFSVYENGLFAFGDPPDDQDERNHANSPIPGNDGPPAMVGPFWEDFRADETNFSMYHDEENHLFVTEWYNSRQYPVDGTFETFEAVIFDPEFYPTITGDGYILFQYHTVVDYWNCSIGIENQLEDDGIEICFFSHNPDGPGEGDFAPTARAIADSSAIFFYVPGCRITGTVNLLPAGDPTDVAVQVDDQEENCQEDGSFSITVDHAGPVELLFSADGYETFSMVLDVEEQEIVEDLQVDMQQLLPPVNLDGQRIGADFNLTWEAPPAGEEVDDFLGLYRIYENGQQIGETEETTFNTVPEPNIDNSYWVTAVYHGGESDSSNHVIYHAPNSLVLPLAANYFELISTYLEPDELNAETVFGDLENLVIVYQVDGGIFLPPALNTIGDIQLTQAYQVFCDADDELYIEGRPINLDQLDYNLFTGRWNWMSFPFDHPILMTYALESIEDYVVILLTDDGRLWVPPFINTVGNMEPGMGYMIFVTEDVNFNYQDGGMLNAPAWESIPAEQRRGSRSEELSGGIQPTGKPYAVLVTMDEKLRTLDPAVLKVYDGNLLVGEGVLDADEQMNAVIAWEGDVTHQVPGFTPGHSIELRLLDSSGNPVDINMTTDPVYGEGAYAQVHLSSPDVKLPFAFHLEKAYPNPFNPAVTVPFTLPADGIVLFTVYNTLGQKIYQVHENYSSGSHQFLFDASAVGNELVNGLYVIRAEYDGQVDFQKVMLLK